MSFGKVKIDTRDQIFSKMIRERDGKCVFCYATPEQKQLTCSHFWRRDDKIHRFDPLNCDALCLGCHIAVEGNKQGRYRDFKLKQLGEEKYKEMERRHYQETKKYGKLEKKILLKILQEQYKNQEHLKPNWKVVW